MKPTFTDRPYDYTLTQRESRDSVRYASSIGHYPQSRTERAAGVVLAVVVGILTAAGFVHWWSMP